MRLNQFIAQATGISRRTADVAIAAGRVRLNGQPATVGTTVQPDDQITLDGAAIQLPSETITIMLNKPPGYVCSRKGQGSFTIYDLLPARYHALKPVGRLDKDSSGLVLLTNDGALAHELTHPKFQKIKIYEVILDKPLSGADRARIQNGVRLEDGLSTFEELRQLDKNDARTWLITMHEGRNRQIRRTFAALGYEVTGLHRTQFGNYQLGALPAKQVQSLRP